MGGDLALMKDNLERLARARDRLGLETTISYNFLLFSFNQHEVRAAPRAWRDMELPHRAGVLSGADLVCGGQRLSRFHRQIPWPLYTNPPSRR